jgi:hypothetical protein
LYRCVSTNTWSLYYIPYTYPHPWSTDGTGTVPSTPTNFRIIGGIEDLLLLLPAIGLSVVGRP